jgi:uncharacterized protein
MKLVFLIFAIVALAWLLRGAVRRRVRPPERGAATQPPEVQTMVACSQCGVLIPSNETLPGRGGVFCSKAHRDAFESTPPTP